ncbi:N-acylglucosamine 2-epimerase-like isoform X2 [Dreissena polymorpha]|uniref:N-acylglucosamine 2-epimerase-like isoform X2 n=1 Tax=Dreissena polymorpha TaxID=45954 RepID=UPI0022642934|nr:N-acylglucosamine 2-epimerase-like isoform X2 [Dreissena polymorpha]
MAEKRLQEFYDEISEDLTRCVQFWLTHSHDNKYGGFFNCLDENGTVYDDTKHIWLQARQVWMYAKLYNEEEKFTTQAVLQAAEKGAEFLMKFAKDASTGRCYLILTRDGRPIKMQRTIFSECFYTMAMSEMAKATKQALYKTEAVQMMDRLIHWVREDDTDIRLGRPPLAGEARSESLAVPMMLQCVTHELLTLDPSLGARYRDIQEWSVQKALSHVQRDGTVVLENVSTSGTELPGSLGRLMIPGHAIEAGWFLLRYAKQNGQDELAQKAIDQFMNGPFARGWDDECGGLYYFLDADRYSPVQLEWNMKMWWVHTETMVAFLMAYQHTRDGDHLDTFARVYDYCYSKHVDKKRGEWFGYLNRDGSVSMRFKGGPWKGIGLQKLFPRTQITPLLQADAV